MAWSAFNIILVLALQVCAVNSDYTSLALANAGTEEIYIDSSTDEVFVQYRGPSEMCINNNTNYRY